MTDADRLELARKLMRASLALPNNHPAQTSLDDAVAALMAQQPSPHPQPACDGRATA